jgi:hypothetical protein
MNYCTVSDIESEMGQQFGQTTQPNLEQVESAIAGVGGEIDGVLQATGYALPVVDVSALALLNRYTKFGACAQAWHSGYVSGDEPARVTYWRETYETFIGRLRRGEQQLPGETIEDEENISFAIAPHPQRDRYWTTGKALDG